ncbi:FAD-binding oxidoreductase [Antarcticibacterium sp. 1MA-6-2]|uniref:NAD(P)/FAD-dependent oxidoreductase n=1 Tax=Antarcticibacterium sp. 1MA-6-2 TaxID=2908210 RepID=UPI001F334B0B|nr:FAD-dependent oxidoreductase [Antarcticibacterium sp. 1MA-6-2]UJH90923.1 FAD-binding oxidoreductase [Antarcticibacterium sp. 1MA-6-2]
MIDYIVVGAGLSGIAVTEELIKRGKSVVVFDNNSQTSSTVAYGVYNPVILKRFTLAWNASEQLTRARSFYRSLQEKLRITLLLELSIYRKFSSVEEQNNWFEAMDKPSLSPFLDPELVPQINENIPSNFSFGHVKETGRVDTDLLVKAYRQHLAEMQILFEEDFNYEKLELTDNGVRYGEINARKVIFCEGFGLRNNPYFNFLPLYGNKGEYIIIKAPELKLGVAVKSSVFILPQGDDLYKIGATYDNEDKTPAPTKEAREKLVKQAGDLLTCNFEVVDQVAGIRPATKDRKPLLGKHPKYNQLFCCNGFGSRGILIAPTMAKELIDHLEDNIPLNPETNFQRFL